MMNNQTDVHAKIALLEKKIHFLLRKYKLLVEQNTSLRNENLILKKQLKDKADIIEGFYNQNKISKIVDKIDSKEENQLRQKIDSYIKEIDKCISHFTK